MLAKALKEKQTSIGRRWLDLILASYPVDSQPFFKREGDEFGNPVGATLRRESEAILQALVEGRPVQELAGPLDNVIMIRAVQDLSAAQAVSFIFLLKQAVREELALDGELPREWVGFERWVDELALLGFDLYLKRREKLFEIRAHEIMNRSKILLERYTNRPSREDGPDGDPGPGPGGSRGER